MSNIFFEEDNHFHYFDNFDINEYRVKTEKLKKGLFVIHAAQYNAFFSSFIETCKILNFPKGIELSVSLKKNDNWRDRDFVVNNNIKMIYSIHSYKSQEEYCDILQHGIENFKIDSICHPFHHTKEIIKDEIMERFIKLCKENNLKVEINNRYFTKKEKSIQLVQSINNNINKENILYSTDAHEPKKIGMYKSKIFEV